MESDKFVGSSDKNTESGFTLVELMIVLMIIILLVAISAVGAISMRVNSNESLAKSSLRTVASACESYHAAQGIYPASLAILGTNYLDASLVSGTKSGYSFTLTSANGGATFTATAIPVSPNYTGVKSSCINALNLILIYNSSSITADGTNCPAGGTALT